MAGQRTTAVAGGAGLCWTLVLAAALLLFPLPSQQAQEVQAMAHKDRGAEPDASMQPRPVFALVCPTDTREKTALCRTLRNALAEKVPGYVFRRVPALDQAPDGQPENMAVALELERMDDREIAARLTWRDPQTGATVSGPLLAMSVEGAELSPRMYPAFVDGLLNSSDLPLGKGGE